MRHWPYSHTIYTISFVANAHLGNTSSSRLSGRRFTFRPGQQHQTLAHTPFQSLQHGMPFLDGLLHSSLTRSPIAASHLLQRCTSSIRQPSWLCSGLPQPSTCFGDVLQNQHLSRECGECLTSSSMVDLPITPVFTLERIGQSPWGCII